MNMKKYAEQFCSQQHAIIAEEEKALSELHNDLSNADFTVGEHNPSTGLLAVSFVFMSLMCAKTVTQEVIRNGWQLMEIFLLCLLAFFGLLTLYQFLHQKYKRKIRIYQKIMFYGKDCWEFRQIDRIECNSSGIIRVIIDGKTAARTQLSDEHAGRLLAWGKKCGIRVDNAYREPELLKRRSL